MQKEVAKYTLATSYYNYIKYFPQKTIEFFTLHLNRIQECADEPVANDTCKIAHEGNPRDVLHVPTEGDSFQSHHNHTCGTTDDEH